MALPEYPWFDQVPDGLKTRRQLAEQGLRPGGPVVAQVVWKRGKRWADLYDVAQAKPKQEATAAQLKALEKARAAQRLCYSCGRDTGMVLWRGFRPEHDCPYCYKDYQEYKQQVRQADADRAAQEARIWLRSPRTLILDTETTDLGGYLVQIAVIRAIDGAVLLDTLVNPLAPITSGAQRAHGITAERLTDAPTFDAIEPQLFAVLRGKRIVTYNADFDRGILRNELARLYDPPPRANNDDEDRSAWGRAYDAAVARREAWLRPKRWRCAMECYAAWYGEYSSYHGSYKWQPLVGGDHSARGDCLATLAVLRRMAGEE